jgi:acetyl-CoA carboxylase biotin carboxyl carrier protein
VSGDKTRASPSRKSDKATVDQGLIRELAALLAETDLTEIEVEQNGLRLRVARQGGGPVPPAFPLTQAQPAPEPVPAAAPAPPAAEPDPHSHPGAVKSPMVGTAYVAPSPSAPPFVTEGDEVKEGQTVMIVEAMKTMNNIPAHMSGKVVRILVANEQPVEYGDVLMIIE